MEVIHLQIEKKNRGGKTVTVLSGFTHDHSYLAELARRLKQSCGTGGTLKDRKIEIQGDCRAGIRELLLKEGFQVKG